ncbi:MAG: ComEC/Rec2 family competence protein, partial [Saprospiraceae bacterium]
MRTIPFVRIGLPFVFGIVCAIWYDRPAPFLIWPLMLGGILLFALAYRNYDYRYRWVFGAYLNIFLWTAGFYRALSYDERCDPEHFSLVAPDATFFMGVIQEQPGKGDRIKCILRICAAGVHPDSMQPCAGRLIAFVRDCEDTARYCYGDLVGLEAHVSPVRPPLNPEAFDYARYLHFKNIHYQANISDLDMVTLSTGHGSWFWKIAYRCREYLLEMLREHFPERHEYAVASALLVGYKDEISDDLREAYMNTGAMHSLVVSGTHVGIVYILLISLIGLFRFRGLWGLWIEAIWVIGGIWAFVMLTGAGASVLRAAIMFT